MNTSQVPRKVWEHPQPEATQMATFKCQLEGTFNIKLQDYNDLYRWSTENRNDFWQFCLKHFPIIHEGSYPYAVDESAPIDSNPDWFPGLKTNFAENILFTPSGDSKPTLTMHGKEDDKVAVTEVREGAAEPIIHLTWAALRKRTGRLLQALKAAGVQRGDRIAIIASNSIDTLVVFLAVTALGAIFSSTSPDTGVKGVVDRLRQIKPKWVFADDRAVYNGKVIDLLPKLTQIVEHLKVMEDFHGLVCIPRISNDPADVSSITQAVSLSQFVDTTQCDELEFTRVGFRDPFLIVYSSGTTGEPKCIVHSVGGVLLSISKEGRLHLGLDSNSTLLQYTTTGWIMYLSCVSALLSGARTVLYDGSPFLPDQTILVKLLAQEKVTHFGTSPRWMQVLRERGISPRTIVDLSELKVVSSTGMVLSEPLFEWFYEEAFPPRVQLVNMSGGTDLAACFVLGNPLSPLYVGGCQGPSLGIPIAAFQDAGHTIRPTGASVPDGEPGELVATAAFPSMPIYFWGDRGGEKYFASYFAQYSNAWTQGDLISIHPVTKQVYLLGRSDGVLNPSGIRFGSAEIYNVIDTYFSSEVMESLCVGQRRPADTDESVILFLLMRPGHRFRTDLVERIRNAIRVSLSARHMPKYIFETPAIPTTVNMKKVELPVKRIVSGEKVKPSGTLMNPESLEFYYQFAQIERVVGGKSSL
ncbi:acetoacetyl-CoA synthase [Aspergillus granulosus]|uniref:Acetoacetyl-CoA synthase n=1 Tax=Aspergillus granulosus TaxID=176169 RepID=A0ABR4H1C7_9EURO